MLDGRWHVRWRPLHTPIGIDCRIEYLDASAATFSEMHEGTRGWSPFNYEVYRPTVHDIPSGVGTTRFLLNTLWLEA